MLKHYLITTIRTLRQNPLYTALSVFGVALTFVFVCVLFLIVKVGKGDFIPPKFAERTWMVRNICHESGPCPAISKEHADIWVSRMTTPEMIIVTSQYIQETAIINEEGIFLSILGVGENYFDAWRYKFLRGRPINRQEIIDAAPVVVLSRSTANLYFGKNVDPIGKIFELNAVQYTVVGIVDNTSFFATANTGGMPLDVIVPLETLKVFNQGIRRIITFTAKDKASVAEMQAEFQRLLEETNKTEDAQMLIPRWQLRTLDKQMELIPGLGIAIVCLILMSIPALNILSLNVSKSYDRNEEIAVRRAFGAPVSTIFAQLFFENFILTLAGAIIGMCITPLILRAIDNALLNFSTMIITLELHLDWKTILLIAGPCVLVFSFLSGSIPAWITAKRDIVNVLKGGETQ